MNSIWLSLLWKEWREQRWKMAALTAVSIGTPLAIIAAMFGMADVDIPEALLGITTAFLYGYALLAGMFVGMSIAASENSHQTARFLQAWPVPPWKVALAKVSIAMVVIALPILLLMSCVWIYSYFQDPESVQLAIKQNIYDFKLPWGMGNLFLARTIAGILGTWSVLIWTIAGGVNRIDEVRAGAISFLIGAGAWCGFAALGALGNYAATLGYETEQFVPLGLLAIAALPGGPGIVNSFVVDSATHAGLSWLALVASAIFVHILLLIWFLKRFGQAPARLKHAGTSWELFSYSTVSRQPFRSGIDAIIWKQVREIGPLALLAVVGICAIAPLIYWVDHMDGGLSRFGDILGSLTIAVSILVVLVTGIGLLYEDYMKGVENFWRSRPIDLNLWFWVKYLTGILVQLLAFLPLIVFSYRQLGWSDETLLASCYSLLLYLLLYCLALAFYALLRQPIYAAILTIAAIIVGWISLVVFIFPNGPPTLLGSVAGALLAMLMPVGLASLLAWQAVVRNWGWKQHR